MTLAIAAWGAAAALALTVGLTGLGGVMALVYLGGLAGTPVAVRLRPQVRSMAVVVVLAIGLSLAMTGLAAQLLIWFGVATRAMLVVTATFYGSALSLLLPPPDDEWVPTR
jgi:hypothetical protein